jgi:VWFA-related protein
MATKLLRLATLFFIVLRSWAPIPQQPFFRLSTHGVAIPVSVKLRDKPVTGLAASTFKVYDNGVRQEVQAISQLDVPADVTLIVDTRQVEKSFLDEVRSGVEQALLQIRPIDRARLFVFDEEFRDVAGWQPPGHAWDTTRIRPSRTGAIYDAILFALAHRPEAGRRHLIIAVTDGRDGDSIVSSATLIDAASRADAVVHFVRVPVRHLAPIAGRNLFYPIYVEADDETWKRLEVMALLTGGTVRPSTFRGNAVARSFAEAHRDFTDGYLVWFTPSADTAGWHELRVEVESKDRLTIRAKRGYYIR